MLSPEDSLRFLGQSATPSYTGFYCCSGTNVLFLEEDGRARGGVCSASKYIGNLFEDSELMIAQNMGVVCCDSAACNSIENTPLPKFRSAEEAEDCMRDFRQRAKAYIYRAEARRLAS